MPLCGRSVCGLLQLGHRANAREREHADARHVPERQHVLHVRSGLVGIEAQLLLHCFLRVVRYGLLNSKQRGGHPPDLPLRRPVWWGRHFTRAHWARLPLASGAPPAPAPPVSALPRLTGVHRLAPDLPSHMFTHSPVRRDRGLLHRGHRADARQRQRADRRDHRQRCALLTGEQSVSSPRPPPSFRSASQASLISPVIPGTRPTAPATHTTSAFPTRPPLASGQTASSTPANVCSVLRSSAL